MSVTSIAALKSPDGAVLKTKYFPDSPLSKAVREILVKSQVLKDWLSLLLLAESDKP